MPMNRKRYPKNWNAIALEIKEAAAWNCEQCGRPCRRPGESIAELIERVSPDYSQKDLWEWEESEEFGLIEVPKIGRFILTVAHLNHQPEDCRRENLKALCSVCHLRYDRPALYIKRQLKREWEGQMRLELGDLVQSVRGVEHA